jgi:hypothetical protein
MKNLFLVSLVLVALTGCNAASPVGPDGTPITTRIVSGMGFYIQLGSYTGELTEAHGEWADTAAQELMTCLAMPKYGGRNFQKSDFGYFKIKLMQPHGEHDYIYCNGGENGACYSRSSDTAEVPGNYLPETTNKGTSHLQPLKHEILHHLYYGRYGKSGSDKGEWRVINGETVWVDHLEEHWKCTWPGWDK